MSGKVCRETRLEIDQSELRQPLSAEAEAHAATCAGCAAFRDERFRLRELVGALEPVVAPADFNVRLRARIARERDSHKQPFIFRFIMSTPAIAVAAVLVMVVGTIVFMNQRNRTPAPSIAATKENKATVPAPAVPAIVENTGSSPVDGEEPSVNRFEGTRRSNVTARNITKAGPTTNAGPEVSDSAVTSAQTIRLSPDRAGEVSLTAPVKPMVVTMYDERGGTRKIQLPAISFGSQRLTDNRTPIAMTNTRDW